MRKILKIDRVRLFWPWFFKFGYWFGVLVQACYCQASVIRQTLSKSQTESGLLKTDQQNHEEIVSLWEEQNLKDLGANQLIQLYTSAYQAIERRCQSTLSSVTVIVVVDRVLHLGSEKYPVLSLLTLEPTGLSFKTLIQNSENYKIEELREALSFFLKELLTVISNITSGVLTTFLHKELMGVTREISLNIQEVQNLHSVKSLKKKQVKE